MKIISENMVISRTDQNVVTFCYSLDDARAPDKRVLNILQEYFFLFLNENTSCDPSLEPSRRDGSNDGSQNVFMEKYGLLSLNYLCYSFLSGALPEGDLVTRVSHQNDGRVIIKGSAQ